MAFDLHLNVAALLRSSEVQAALSEACVDMNGTKVSALVGELDDVRPGEAIFVNPDVLLLDVDPTDDHDVARLGEIIHKQFPNTPVVATAKEVSLQAVRQLMRLGVVDFVPQPITRDDLIGALQIAARRRPELVPVAPGRRGKILTFLKAGGGVGSTTLAVQSACMLAGRARAASENVCLFDLDIQFGSAALYLDLPDRTGLADLIEYPERIDGELLRNVALHHPSGLDLVPAPRDMMALEILTPEVIETVLRQGQQKYGHVLVDLPEAWTPWSYKVLEVSDLVILVTQLTVAGVRRARRQIDTMMANGLEQVQVKVALNRYEKSRAQNVTLKEAETALGRSFDYLIPSDYKTVSEALDQGVALGKIKKRSKVATGIESMVDQAVRVMAGDSADKAEPRFSFGLRR